ncbi:MAG: FAD-binding protein [Gemmatimonadetes bacterium]|nr:FAD-binding protein [Gemmatimonadota bacterium]
MPTSSLTRTLESALAGIVGRESVLTEPGELLSFESDALTAYRATPAAVVFVHDTDQVQRVVSLLYKERIPFVPRGAGTGLSGGALADGAVIIQLSRMNRILWVDEENGRARVQPGVVNTQLNEAAAAHGLMYAPDPSSQTVSTLGGNVAENSGGPHCLKYGVTSNHILGLTFVTPEGKLVDLEPDGRPGYDLVGTFVGSEGTLGICTEIEVRLVPIPAAVETTLAHFDDVGAAGRAVSAIIAAGIVPAALEMIDRNTIRAVEASVYAAGFPTDVAASLIVELDGPKAGLAEQAADVEKILNENGAREVARAKDDADRTKFWKARKSAFGAMGRIGSELMVQDATVPRSRLPDVLDRVYEVAKKYDLTITNVFHAGDGNLHPNIPFDARDEALLERVHAASREIMEACVEAGGTITGEHGVGVDKRKYMRLVYSEEDLQAMRWVKDVFDPDGLCNPGKLLPDDAPTAAAAERPVAAGPSEIDVGETIRSELGAKILVKETGGFVIDGEPAEVVAAPDSIDELAELMKLATAHGWIVVPAGQGGWSGVGTPLKRHELVVSTRRLNAPVEHHPDDLIATVQAGIPLSGLQSSLEERGQWWPVDTPGGGTVGAILATGAAGPLAVMYGAPRDLALGLTVVLADGRVVRAGGRVVKNVAGYDMVKLFTGSWGTLGIIAEAHLRLHARPPGDETRVFVAGRPDDLVAFAARLARSGSLPPAATEIVSPAVADALDMRTGHWRMAVRWLGFERAVTDAIAAAERAATEVGLLSDRRKTVWDSFRTLETQLGSALTLRVDAPMRAMDELLHRATVFTGSEFPLVQASPLDGRAWIFVPDSLYESGKGERMWALRIEELRRVAAERGGGARIERAPVALRGTIDPWGDTGAAQRLHGGLKLAFDPNGTLMPGFFVGGL